MSDFWQNCGYWLREIADALKWYAVMILLVVGFSYLMYWIIKILEAAFTGYTCEPYCGWD